MRMHIYVYVLQVRMCVCICARILYPNKIRLTSVPCSFCWSFTVWDPHTHTLTHIHKADTAVDGVLSLSCILWLSFLLIFLFQLRARITHIQLQLARLLARPFSLCRYIFIWVCWTFLFVFWQQQSPFYFPRTFSLRLRCLIFPESEGNIMLFRIIPLY